MTGKDLVRRWLTAPPLTGKAALLCAIVMLAVPTLIRAAVDGTVSGVGFTPYMPFVLISALLLRWRDAALVAVAAAFLGDFMFVGIGFQVLETPDDVFGGIMFLLSAALVIALGHAIKSIVHDRLWLHGPDHRSNGVVFSLKEGQAHVSWYGERAFVQLGPEQEVAEMMQDFLAQRELGRRLVKQVR